MSQANNNSDQKSREMASTDNDIVVFLRILLIQFLWIINDIVVFLRILLIQFLWIIPNYLINNTRSTFGSTFDLQIASGPIDTYIGMWFKLQSYGCHACVSKSFYKSRFLRLLNEITNESSHHSKYSELQYKKYVWKFIWSLNCLRPKRSVAAVERINFAIFWPSDMSFCTTITYSSNNFRAELVLKNTQSQ